MKFIPSEDSRFAMPTIELTRRNLQILLAKLDDPISERTIVKDGYAVRAVEDVVHYSTRHPGAMVLPSSGEML